MSLFPMFLKLDGRPCLVVGAGKIGEGKIRSLLVARAKVRVIALAATPAVSGWARAGVLTLESREFRPDDLSETFLAIAATSSIDVNDAIYREATRRQVLCNVVDDPERCDFYYPAVVRRGALQVAISTEGKSPALAQKLRREFEQLLAPFYAGWIEQLGKIRNQLFRQPLNSDERRRLLHRWAAQLPFTQALPEDAFLHEVGHER
jgi:precorrin-2 dehydrogenase